MSSILGDSDCRLGNVVLGDVDEAGPNPGIAAWAAMDQLNGGLEGGLEE